VTAFSTYLIGLCMRTVPFRYRNWLQASGVRRQENQVSWCLKPGAWSRFSVSLSYWPVWPFTPLWQWAG